MCRTRKGGGPALAAVVAGEADVSFLSLAAALPQIRAGRLRALAITTVKRSRLLPQVATVAESGVPGYEFTSWVGMLAPGTTPPAIVGALNGHIVKAMRAADFAARFANEGTEIVASTPEHFRAHLRSELTRWGRVVKASGMKAE